MTRLKQGQLAPFGNISTEMVVKAAEQFGTPFYLYDESVILQKCQDALSMPNAFGLTVRYAIKANANRALLQLITKQDLHLDCLSWGDREGLKS